MNTSFKVEIKGHEYSIYGGAAGDYCGTKVSPNQVMDFLELPEEKYGDMTILFLDNRQGEMLLHIVEDRDYLYWAPSHYRVLVEPCTGNHGINIDKIFTQLVYSSLGWKEYQKGRFEEYWKAKNALRHNHSLKIKDLQKMIKAL